RRGFFRGLARWRRLRRFFGLFAFLAVLVSGGDVVGDGGSLGLRRRGGALAIGDHEFFGGIVRVSGPDGPNRSKEWRQHQDRKQNPGHTAAHRPNSRHSLPKTHPRRRGSPPSPASYGPFYMPATCNAWQAIVVSS